MKQTHLALRLLVPQFAHRARVRRQCRYVTHPRQCDLHQRLDCLFEERLSIVPSPFHRFHRLLQHCPPSAAEVVEKVDAEELNERACFELDLGGGNGRVGRLGGAKEGGEGRVDEDGGKGEVAAVSPEKRRRR
jgi:hypothetical protein